MCFTLDESLGSIKLPDTLEAYSSQFFRENTKNRQGSISLA